MNIARTKALSVSLLVISALGSSAVAFAGSYATNGNFNTPTSSSVTWGTLSPGGGSVGGPGTVTWGPSQYGYDPTGINGWQFSGGAGVQENGSAWGFSNAPAGASQTAFLQSGLTGSGSISQEMTGLTIGQTYTVTFDLEQRPGYGADPVTVTIDGVSLTVTPPNDDQWTQFTESFTANGTYEDLVFSVAGAGTNDNDTGLADVSMTAPTPEPGTLLLLGTGLFGLAFVVFRKGNPSGQIL